MAKANTKQYTGPGYLIGVDKPCNMTSHDVVDKVRRAVGTRRVGHAGTLDPMASGVMVLGVGCATRLLNYLSSDRKCYVVRAVFGCETDTCDAEGDVVLRRDVPKDIFDDTLIERGLSFIQTMTQQVPPAYSAVHVDGKRAYELARKGVDVELESRPVEVYGVELISTGALEPQGAAFWDLSVDVSKGTYVRSIVRDLGRYLDTAAYVGELRRTSSGNVGLGRCQGLEALAENGVRALNPVPAMGCACFESNDTDRHDVFDGKRLSYERSRLRGCPDLDEGDTVAFVYDKRLYAMMRREGSALQPIAVFREGVLMGEEVVR